MAGILMLDVDGVLVTRRRPGAFSWSDGLEADLGFSKEALMTHFFKPYWGQIVTGKLPLMAQLRVAMAEIDPSVSAERVRDYWFAEDSAVQAPVLADVATLRGEGWHVWLSTNQEHERAAYLMDVMGLRDDVDGMVYSADLGVKKPHPAFYRAADAVVGAGAKVLVDDTLQNVEAAQVHGWRGHHWQPGDRLLTVCQESGLQ